MCIMRFIMKEKGKNVKSSAKMKDEFDQLEVRCFKVRRQMDMTREIGWEEDTNRNEYGGGGRQSKLEE